MYNGITTLQAQALNIGKGVNPRGLLVADCTPLKNAPTVASVMIDWSLYNVSSIKSAAIDIDLNAIATSEIIDAFRSIYIDNSYSSITVFAVFGDTNYVAACPPNSITTLPIWTNLRRCKLFATGFLDGLIPITNFIFSNAHSAPFTSNANAANPFTKTIQRLSHTWKNTGAGSTNQSFTVVNLGTPTPSRALFFVLYWNTNGGGNTVPQFLINSFLTPALLAVGGTGTFGVAIYGVADSSLTNVTLNVNFALACVAGDNMAVDVYTTNNLFSPLSPIGTVTSIVNNVNANLTTLPDGIIIAASMINSNANTNPINGVSNNLNSADNNNGLFSMSTNTAYQNSRSTINNINWNGQAGTGGLAAICVQ